MSFGFVGAVPVPKPQSSPLAVLVTGAARGLGRELVKQYAEAHKDNIVFAGVRNPSAPALKPLSALPNVHIIALDVADEASIRASLKEVESHTDHLDVLINNAGIAGQPEAMNPTTATAQQFTEVFTTNVTGTLLTTQTYLPLLRKAAEPKVVNVSSGLGSNQLANMIGQPVVSYGVSKAALNYLTTAFRYAEPKVAFLAISPGWVDTDMGSEGGRKPPVTPPESVQAQRYYIAEKGLANSGEFFDVMSGQPIAY